MNQSRCQKGKLYSGASLDSLYTIRAAPEAEVLAGVEVEEEEEEVFLRDRLGDPEEATVRYYRDQISSERERDMHPLGFQSQRNR